MNRIHITVDGVVVGTAARLTRFPDGDGIRLHDPDGAAEFALQRMKTNPVFVCVLDNGSKVHLDGAYPRPGVSGPGEGWIDIRAVRVRDEN